MKGIRGIISILSLLFCVSAQAVSFRVEAPGQVIEGQKFSITYMLENAPESPDGEPKPGEVANCKLLGPVGISQSSSYSNVNGKVSTSATIGYSYTYRAMAAGKVTIAAVKITVGGKTYTTKPKQLEILPPDRSVTNGQSQSVQAYDISSQTADKPVGRDEVFVRIECSKPSVFEQEGVLCSIKLYSKYQVSKFVTNVQPAYNGFMAQEVPVNAQGKMESVNGDNYFSYLVKQFVLFPQQAGTLKISSGSYDLTVLQFETINTPFGRMRSPIERTVKMQSNSAELNVVPLPTPRPSDFTGAVGKFQVARSLSGNSVRTNEASSIKLTVQGAGNLKGLSAPTFGFPPQFDQYDPQTNVTAEPSGNTLRGKVEVEYTFVPQSVGKFTIPGTSFSFFNPETRKYERIEISGFDLDVAKGTSSGAVKFNQEPMRDILPIYKGNLDVSKERTFMIGAWYYVVSYVLAAVAFIIVLFVYRRTLKERSNVTLMKKKGANRVANKRLKRARGFMRKGREENFCEEMLSALWGYFSDKLSIPVSELNRDNISRELAGYGLAPDSIDKIIGIIDECEFARYARSAGGTLGMEGVYTRACDSIGEVENIKRK